MPEIVDIVGLNLWSNKIRYYQDGTEAIGSCFTVWIDNCNEFCRNIMYTKKDPWMSEVDGRGR
jgi:hypothetical protein